MGKSSKHVTIGYQYFFSSLVGVCHGAVNTVNKVMAGGKTAWEGRLEGTSPTFRISAANLFGGAKAEGGYAGTVHSCNGEVSPAADAKMTALGSPRPLYKGLTSLLFYDFLWTSMTAYVKAPSVQVYRTTAGWHNDAPWYPAKANIAEEGKQWTPFWTTWTEGTLLSDFTTITAGEYFSTTYMGHTSGSGSGLWIHAIESGIVHPRIKKTLDQASPLRELSFKFSVIDRGDGDNGSVVLRDASDAVVASIGFSRDAAVDALQRLTVALVGTSGAAGEPIGSVAVAVGGWYQFHLLYDPDAATFTVTLTNLDTDTLFATETFSVSAREDVASINFENDLDGGDTRAGAAYVDNVYLYTDDPSSDMNPAHIIYQCLTDPEWGMGYPVADIDDASFTAAADALYDEGFGMSLGWFAQTPIEDFIQIVLDHINGVLRLNPSTGKFELKIFRDDYVIGALPVVNEDNIIGLRNFARAAWGDVANEVVLKYEDYDGNEKVKSVHNLAAIEAQGGIVTKSVSFVGLRSDTLAARVAQRELLRASTLLAQAQVTCTRALSFLRPGDVVNFQWAALGIDSVAMRVLEVGYGDSSTGAIDLQLTEDIFGLPQASYVTAQESLSEDLVPPASDAVQYKLVEYPYYAKNYEMPPADVAAMTPEACLGQYLMAGDIAANTGFKLYKSSDGVTYEQSGNSATSAYGLTSGAITYLTGTITLASYGDLDEIVVGDYGWLGDEQIRFDAVDADTGIVVLGRGCNDTVPVEHADGTLLIRASDSGVVDLTERTASTTAYYKALVSTPNGELSLEDAAALPLTFTQRADRPYPPGDFKLNSSAYPATISGPLTVSWAHRDRTQQLADVVDTTEASIGPEATTTYTVTLYNENGVVARTATGLTGTSYTWSTEAADSGLDSTVSLLGFNGANATTVFFDPYGKTWTPAGNAQISTAQSKFGGASGYFDGTGDYLTTPSHADFSVANTDDLTIECWIRPAVVNAIKYLATKRVASGGGDPHEWALGTDATGHVFMQAWANGTAVVNIASSSTLTANTWYHVAACRSTGGAWQLFIDGASVGTATESATPTSNSALVYVGRLNGDTSCDYSGYIDSFRFTRGLARYTGAFTPPTDEPLPSYTAALLNFNGTDGATTTSDAAYTRTWTFNGNAQLDTARFKYGTASLLLDGTGDYLTTPSSPTLDVGDFDWTAEAWVYLTGSVGNTVIATKRAAAGTNGGWQFGIDSSSFLQFAAYSASTSVVLLTGTTVIATSRWYHVAVSRSGTTWRMFLDGDLEDSDTESALPTANTTQVILGRHAQSTAYDLQGHLDDFRITKGHALYTAAFTPPAAELAVATSSALNSEVRVRLKAVRDGLDSFTEHDFTVTR